MSPALIAFIIEAIEKGTPIVVEAYHEISDAIVESKKASADEKVNLLNRLNKAILPERFFVQKTVPQSGT